MIKNITNVRGFTCWGAHSGVKSLRRDLAIIFSEVPASIGVVFTQNQLVSEPVKISREHVKNGLAQAIVVNAGNANACTGSQGRDGALAMVRSAAASLGIDEDLVLVSSTGVIGKPFPTDEIVRSIDESVPKLSSRSSAGSFAANAILTTDTFAKEGFMEFSVDGREVNLAGIAKGSGMIHPNMATMLAFIVTDIDIEPNLLQIAVNECVDESFNMITVDGDTSPSDMVAVMANGLAGNKRLDSGESKDYKVFRNNLLNMMQHLAKLIVSDGEGSSKFVEYRIENAPDKKTARKIARTISNSNLVKTAMFGRDPNWGRIVSAAGNAGVPFDYTAVDLYLGNEKERVKVLEKGRPVSYDRNFMKKLLRESHLSVKMDLCNGEESATAWGSDLTTDYVLFNSVYTT